MTTDNCFSSVPLPQCLLHTLLWGIYNRMRQTSFLWWFPSPGRFTTQSLHSNLCMVSYITKKGMAVWLLSMMHHNKMVDEKTRKRKNIIYHILQQAQRRCRYQCLHLFHGSAPWIQEQHHHSITGLPSSLSSQRSLSHHIWEVNWKVAPNCKPRSLKQWEGVGDKSHNWATGKKQTHLWKSVGSSLSCI